MFICKKCRTEKEKVTKEDNKCEKCGGEEFTTREMEQAIKAINKIFS